MSKKEKKGRKPGLCFEIASSVILILLSMFLGIALFCHEWQMAIVHSLYIILWALWVRAQKANTRLLYENRHLKGLIVAAIAGLEAATQSKEDNDEHNAGNSEAEAPKDNNDGKEQK